MSADAPTAADSSGWTAHTPDPTKYHSAEVSGYVESHSSGDRKVLNPPRTSGSFGAGVMIPRQDPLREGLSSGCDPHDPANHTMVIDPHLGGTQKFNPSQRPIADDALAAMMRQVQTETGYTGVDLRREAAARLLEQSQTKAAAVRPQTSNTIPPPDNQRGSILQRFEAPVTSGLAPAAEPNVKVLFEIPGVGENEVWYHEVLFEQGPDKTGFLILISDTRFRGHRYFPPALETPIGVQVGEAQTYKVLVPGIKFTHNELTYCLLFVADTLGA